MKRLMVSLALGAALCLSGCSASINSGETKSKMESNGYTVEIYNKEEAKVHIVGVKYNVEIVDALYAEKDKNNVLVAFYCASIDDASSFLQENIQAMYAFAIMRDANAKTGSHNNVAYAGSASAITAAGFGFTE